MKHDDGTVTHDRESCLRVRENSWRNPSMGYWMKPAFVNGPDGGNLIVGPIQINWYAKGWRIHLTWPHLRTWEMGR